MVCDFEPGNIFIKGTAIYTSSDFLISQFIHKTLFQKKCLKNGLNCRIRVSPRLHLQKQAVMELIVFLIVYVQRVL